MYFPFLRGKQFELIAIRELSDSLSSKRDKISPIIEPVKDSFTTLRSTLEALKSADVNFNLIVNPIVGDLTNNCDDIYDLIKDVLDDYTNFQIAFYVNDTKNIGESLRLAKKINFDFNGFSFIHTSQVPNLSDVKKFDGIKKTTYHIIDLSKTSRRYHRNFVGSRYISLENHFLIQDRNSDYAITPDEFFSEEHLFYTADGFSGFSDYLTVGDSFSEAGFAPYAVAIHLTYPDKDNKIRIHHFVSNSNEDTTDVAGKFAEALEKLVAWVNKNKFTSEAIEEFKELHRDGHFPGLGYVKKLSIKHHIELVLNLI